MKAGHVWKFFRAGGFDQVRLDTGADLAALDQLDQKLWVALSCPTRGVEFDTRTLDLIDTDKDGRIRAPELIAAAKWACRSLKKPDDLLKGLAALPLDAIQDSTPEGLQLIASAKRILEGLGKSDATSISADDAADTARIFAQMHFNGDGIVPADATEDEAVKAVISDIIACLGAETDRSGKPGVSQAKADQFFADAKAYSDWVEKAEGGAGVLPLGEATGAAAATLRAVKAKVDDYFARCRLAAFDSRAQAALNREEKEYLALAAKDLTITSAEIAGFPLARVEAGRPLPLTEAVNPAWAGAVAKFKGEVVTPLLGAKSSLSESDWAALGAKFAVYEAWVAAKAGSLVEKLGVARVRQILGGGAREALAALIARDKAAAPDVDAIAKVEQLARYYRDLCKLVVNFVSFRDFYGRKEKAIFQAGTLYLDQRSCDLCLMIDDVGKHSAMAATAGSYLAYCDCTRKSTGQKIQIVAAFTDGDSDSLMVGRNGIFYDRKGQDWDATIAKIVDNPISLRQAFWSPYKKFVRMIEEQFAKRAAAADSASEAKLQASAAAVVTADKAKPAEPKKFDVGTVAALGVGVGAIATVLGGLVAGLLKLAWWQYPLALIGLIIVISLPSVAIAGLKLRKRTLGPLLDANGWAVNAKAKLNIPFGRSLTGTAQLPPGSHRDMVDPYAEKKTGRNVVAALVVLLLAVWALWWFGLFERLAPGCLPKASWLQHREAPAPVSAVEPAATPPAKTP